MMKSQNDLFLLDQIDANPWQPRDGEDVEHVKNLAASILADGLMQAPVGRIVGDRTGTEYKVQLAFGHSRLAAFKLLRDEDHPDFELMPTVIRELSDEDMFRLAVTENVQRRDLSPMEEARAMLRYRDEFGKTSGEIGALFGLAESSVRNKIRLLGLPPEIQEAASKGQISEGAARELLRLYELPEDLQKKAREYRTRNWEAWPIVAKALEGALASDVHKAIDNIVSSTGTNLHAAQWKFEQVFDLFLDARLKCETCKACEFKMEIDHKTFCTQFGCYQAKRDLWIRGRLAAASEVCGIRVPENIHDVGSIAVPAEVRQSGCANLRVVYDNAIGFDNESLVPGFANVKIVCGNRNSICTCMNGLVARQVAQEKAKQSEESQKLRAKVPEADGLDKPAPAIEVQAPRPGPTADELRQAARDDRQAQRVAVKELEGLREEFARRVRDAMLAHNRFAWCALLLDGRYSLKYKREEIGLVEESAYQKALHFAEANSTYYSKIDLDRMRQELNELLVAMELRPIEAQTEEPKEPVYEAIEETEAPRNGPYTGVRSGQTLAEVFQEEEDQQFHQAMDAVSDGHQMPRRLPGETLMDYFARTDQGI